LPDKKHDWIFGIKIRESEESIFQCFFLTN